MIDLLTAPPSTDIAYEWIRVLFPTGGADPYSAAVAVFSSMLAFFGSMFLAWHVIQGIVLTAYKGKVMGERFHQIWAPLRVILGFGLMVPISGGFSSIHLLLRDVIGVAAVNMGNYPVKAYIAAATTTTVDKQNPFKVANINVASTQGRNIYDQFLKKEICYAVDLGLNYEQFSVFGVPFLTYNPFTVGSYAGDAKPGEVASGGHIWDYGTCGKIQMPAVAPMDDSTETKAWVTDFTNTRAQEVAKIVEAVRKEIKSTKLSSYFKNHDITNMSSDAFLKELITVGAVPADLSKTKDPVVAAYNKNVSVAARTVYTKMLEKAGKELTAKIDKYGFMAAGSFERSLSKVSAATVQNANTAPKITNPTLTPKIDIAYRSAVVAVLGASGTQSTDPGAGNMKGTSLKDNPFDAVVSWISPSIASMQAGTGSTTKDPLGDMITFGHNLLAIWEAGISGMLVIREFLVYATTVMNAFQGGVNAGAGAVTGGSGSAAIAAVTSAPLAVMMDLFQFAWGWVVPLFTIILVVGILHAFVLPMLPMMMVFVMGVSWLILFLEASIAGLLWAFVFIRMDGEDFVDRAQAQGASLLFNLFLRPAISMLAFLGGLLLLPTLMDSLTILWDDSFSSQTTPDYFGLVQWVVGVVLYTWMQWHLTLRLFGLIPTIADRVGSWMGFNSHTYNDGQETTAAVGAAVAAGSAARMLGKKGGPNSFDQKQAARSQEKADLQRQARNANNAGK
ncbi:DotA/TraY family protein [Agrobacterium rubi]|nr:DotA/TraY family protein [Agrobacterium rubi]NTF24314.1 DotA/TraY family protein [Agrobacterium rubi]